MNIPAKPVTGAIEIHGNRIDGREAEAAAGEMLDVRHRSTGIAKRRHSGDRTEIS
jgi:hypothetical protein